MKAAILDYLERHTGHPVSGEDISDDLGVSRSAVWKQIKALRDAGYDIDAAPHRGYILRHVPDIPYPWEVLRRLRDAAIPWDVRYFPSVTSTNDRVREAMETGSPEGLVVVADEQTRGRGRRGRQWFSPPGTGLWMSVLLKPRLGPHDVSKMTLVAALAVAEAIWNVTGLRCGLKWPNDVQIRGRKVAGILLELQGDVERVHSLIMGIGVNVNTAAGDFEPDIRPIATSLRVESGERVNRSALLAAILQELETRYLTVQERGFDAAIAEVKGLSTTLGRPVVIQGLDEDFEGEAVDLGTDGSLIVQLKNGEIRHVYSGDVSLSTMKGEV